MPWLLPEERLLLTTAFRLSVHRLPDSLPTDNLHGGNGSPEEGAHVERMEGTLDPMAGPVDDGCPK
jgi:hypothetical protein